jgi:hypothetical protein
MNKKDILSQIGVMALLTTFLSKQRNIQVEPCEHKVWNKIHVMFLGKSLGQVDFISKNTIL